MIAMKTVNGEIGALGNWTAKFQSWAASCLASLDDLNTQYTYNLYCDHLYWDTEASQKEPPLAILVYVYRHRGHVLAWLEDIRSRGLQRSDVFVMNHWSFFRHSICLHTSFVGTAEKMVHHTTLVVNYRIPKTDCHSQLNLIIGLTLILLGWQFEPDLQKMNKVLNNYKTGIEYQNSK